MAPARVSTLCGTRPLRPSAALAVPGNPLRGLLQKLFARMLATIAQLPPELQVALRTTLYLSLPMSAVGALGGVVWQLYGSFRRALNVLINKHLQVSMLFTSHDKHYDVVIDYIGAKCAVETGKILASTKPRSRPSFAEMLANWLGGKMKSPTLYYQPDLHQDFSSCFYWTDKEGVRHKIWVVRYVEKPQFRSDSNSKQRDPETLVLSMWWSTNSQPLKEFLGEALKTMLSEDCEGRVDIYVKHMWLPMWTKAISKERRDRDTVVLDENLAETLVDDLRHFFTRSTADWYNNAGIPYRRGYLLYGPPGCGKTSFAQVLAGELGLDVCLMNLSNQEMNDDDLAELLRNAPGRSMLLLEDVDAIFVERAAASGKNRGGISFSGLLNALDGAAAQEGCVIMLTTNHKDRLDEALIRPGRCDVHVHITKASKDQAKRMFYRFFARETRIKAVEGGLVTTERPHGLRNGDPVMSKRGGDKAAAVAEKRFLYAHVPAGTFTTQTKLTLYDSAEAAREGGAGFIALEGGKGTTLQSLPEAAVRFSSRIPERQVSMAKLQGYFMKQKLHAEQSFNARKLSGSLPGEFSGLDPLDDLYKFMYEEEVRKLASEGSVMNVHELLDVKVEMETEEARVPVYDHLRRVGVHPFASLFEHFGVRFKQDLGKSVQSRMETWHPDLKINSPQRDRLIALIEGDKKLDASFALADLSVLRDRFLAAYQVKEDTGAFPAAPPSTDVPADEDDSAAPAPPPRLQLLRSISNVTEPELLNLLEMAHAFQERLEKGGKTEVSMWQLDTHFMRYEGDPKGALENCEQLLHGSADRTASERTVPWVTTFGFLRRLGLEQYAFALEDAGFKLWSELKSISLDDLKAKGEMPQKPAKFCHDVLSCSGDRPDSLRMFQIPEFGDIVDMFCLRFPQARKRDGQKFALLLTDELGITEFSCHQVQAYLDKAVDMKGALADVEDGLLPLPKAEAARVRPEAPPPKPEPDDWVYKWLTEAELQGNYGAFSGQALTTREDVMLAPLDHEALKQMGIQKIGDRSKILRMIEAEKASTSNS